MGSSILKKPKNSLGQNLKEHQPKPKNINQRARDRKMIRGVGLTRVAFGLTAFLLFAVVRSQVNNEYILTVLCS